MRLVTGLEVRAFFAPEDDVLLATNQLFDGRVAALAWANWRMLESIGVWPLLSEAEPIPDLVAEGWHVVEITGDRCDYP